MGFFDFLKRKPTKIFLENKYSIEEAFVCQGVKYLMFSDIKNAPTDRMMAALMVYNEMEMKCDKKYLERHCKAMRKICDQQKVTMSMIGYIVQLNKHLEERINLMVMPDYIYKLATVVFFDQTENPYGYDLEYAEKKIELWKKEPDMLTFFLKSPLKTLIPYLNLQPENINIFSKMISQVNEIHQQLLTDILSDRSLINEKSS